jgi:hypothetical protein
MWISVALECAEKRDGRCGHSGGTAGAGSVTWTAHGAVRAALVRPERESVAKWGARAQVLVEV